VKMVNRAELHARLLTSHRPRRSAPLWVSATRYELLMHGLEVKDDPCDGSRERVGRLVLVVAVNNQAVAAAYVHPGVGREPGRSG
jgi:hypothetical protein